MIYLIISLSINDNKVFHMVCMCMYISIHVDVDVG